MSVIVGALIFITALNVFDAIFNIVPTRAPKREEPKRSTDTFPQINRLPSRHD